MITDHAEHAKQQQKNDVKEEVKKKVRVCIKKKKKTYTALCLWLKSRLKNFTAFYPQPKKKICESRILERLGKYGDSLSFFGNYCKVNEQLSSSKYPTED